MTNTEVAPPLPALYNHCCTVFAAMEKKAYTVGVEGTKMLVYEGKFTQLVKDCDLSVPYYSFVRKALIGMGCIKQLRRGGGGAFSQWELIRAPSAEAWSEHDKIAPKPTASIPQGATAQQVRDLNTRLTQLELVVKEMIETRGR